MPANPINASSTQKNVAFAQGLHEKSHVGYKFIIYTIHIVPIKSPLETLEII